MAIGDQVICPECNRPFLRRSNRGRPQRYCGSTCRRASEFALARVQSLLKRAEARWQDASLKLALAGSWEAKNLTKVRGFWAGEVERLRAELRRVIEGSEAPATTSGGEPAAGL